MNCKLSKTLQHASITVQIYQKEKSDRRLMSDAGFLAEERGTERR